MTENAAICTMVPADEPYRPGSVGRPHVGVEVRIVGEDSQALPPRIPGEIISRGRSTMRGYYNRPDETAETVRDGWLYSGDIGYLDDDGWLFVVDRKKDMIIRGGENIFPAELEAVLYEHPAVLEAAVVGIPDEVYGEKVIAFVALQREARPTADELRDFMAQDRQIQASRRIPDGAGFTPQQCGKSASAGIANRGPVTCASG